MSEELFNNMIQISRHKFLYYSHVCYWILWALFARLAILSLLLCFILLLVLISILVLPLLLYLLIQCFVNKQKIPNINENACNLYEYKMLKQELSKGLEFMEDWIELTIENDIIRIHSIISKSEVNTNENKPNLLWIHGFGGSAAMSLYKSEVASRISVHFNIYGIDLPGFGRSVLPSSYKCESTANIKEVLIKSIVHYIQSKGLTKVYLCGHSFGSFIALNVADRYITL